MRLSKKTTPYRRALVPAALFRVLLGIAAAVLVPWHSAVAAGPDPQDMPLDPDVSWAMPWEARKKSGAYVPPRGMTAQETVAAYFGAQYEAYTSLEPIDMGAILDLELNRSHNMQTWLDMLIQRRRLLQENGLCYVDTRRYPYRIRFIEAEEVTDGRIEKWMDWAPELIERNGPDDEVLLHFVIEGEEGVAYPPMMAVNAQHSVRMKLDEDIWRISLHYFPGSARRYMLSGILQPVSDEEMLEELLLEFASVDDTPPVQRPAGSVPYDGERAAEYAALYTETPNPAYYLINDWIGNCANFTSQCVLYGYGGKGMDSTWYSGGGGGTLAWENVDFFWQYVLSPGGLEGVVLEGADALQTGDIVQIRVPNSGSVNDFTHSLLVADGDTLLLAQNSPACFTYYSDLVNVKNRLFRPLYR